MIKCCNDIYLETVTFSRGGSARPSSQFSRPVLTRNSVAVYTNYSGVIAANAITRWAPGAVIGRTAEQLR